ncbi:unnamed protein product [Clonostachys rhizophaga]|uniref:AttH domain-containing protein n=1 Tax=Clonostachys rhizophaga TaxID=160324 RepID=A0A9N9V2P0_9HYPO|nr:unnamed protein product [Clonostachys rhizophaga]
MMALMVAVYVLGSIPNALTYMFRPDSHSTYENSHIPTRYNLIEDQGDSGSFWLCSFLTSTTGKQYLALQHILGSAGYSSICKSFLPDLETKSYWNNLTTCEPVSHSSSNPIDIHLGSYGFGATSEDKISSLHAFNSVKDYSYDLTFEAKSKVLLNGGNGVITFGQGFTNSTEWAIPALKTNGTFSVGKEKLQVDAAKSFTCIWAYDLAAPAVPTENRFATIRFGEEAHLALPYTLIASTTNVWRSDHRNVTYPLSWTFNFENGDRLEVDSVRGDQEIYGGEQIGNTVYAGFIEAKGKFLGQHAGFGVVEMIQLW